MSKYEIVRAIAELIYFLVVSGGLLVYAIKSYNKSVEQKSELMAQIYIDYKEKLERGMSVFPAYLQIYNAGNAVAKNAYICTDDEEVKKYYSIFDGNIGFVEPGQSIFVPIGYLEMYMSGDNELYLMGLKARELKEDNHKYWISYDNKTADINLNIEYLFRTPRTPVGRSSEESTTEKIEKNLSTIGSELKSIEKAIAKKK